MRHAGWALVPGYHSCLSEVRPALASDLSRCGDMKAGKVLDSSVPGEEREGLNCVEDGVVCLREKGKGRPSRQGEERSQAGTEMCASAGSRELHVVGKCCSTACPTCEWRVLGLGVCVRCHGSCFNPSDDRDVAKRF